ncbi:MAG: ATP-dependent DNA helicase [Lachnospiraceae bacterium]|nr:ATP-dependent DNA helicase [Lachnospiraceae bacterium]
MKNVTVSVRSLVEFLLRSGDIDNRKDVSGDPDAMQEGLRIHKKIQKSMPAGYRAEVTLKETRDYGDIALTIEGRADGIWEKEEEGQRIVIIDEIKSMYANLDYLNDPKPVHLAQARVYAAIYGPETNLEKIGVQLTYCDIDTEEIKRFRFSYRIDELRQWIGDLAEKYMIWVRMAAEHERARDESIMSLQFPYEYRTGQKELAIDVYRAIKLERNLFINAPTGVGKTLSVLYPSLKAVGEGLASRIFYLTAKTVTAGVATSALALLEQHGLNIRAVHITAKEKACANGDFICNPDACPYAEGHFDRVNDAVFDIITHESIITREVIFDYAEKHKVCPYEFSLDVSNWCDAIIGDYNYAFDPRVRLKRFFEGQSQDDFIFLVDEAHNLASRAGEMYSATIIKEDVLECARMVKGMSKTLTSALTVTNKKMLELKRECDDSYVLYNDVADLAKAMTRLQTELSKLMEKQKFFDTRDDVLEFFFKVKKFNDIYAEMFRGYKIYGKIQSDGSFCVKLLCVNPSDSIQSCLAAARSAVFFSATLLPMPYYKELITGDQDDYAIYAETSFTQDQRLLAAARDVSSRYTRRNAEEYSKIAEYIRRVVSVRKGNYIAFFPSYEFMEHVREFVETYADDGNVECMDVLVQNQKMSEKEREEFLAEFGRERDRSLLGLCVMGGIFSEGIDLTDEKLIGAMIIGTGLPMINTESEIARKYFDEDGKDGFAYAYRFPGMNKVMQAAGRVIRKETDRGVILLLDERFNYSDYRSLFPREWSDCRTVNLSSVGSVVESFWNN